MLRSGRRCAPALRPSSALLALALLGPGRAIQRCRFPLLDRNPQTFGDIFHAPPEAYRKATRRVYRSPETPSFVSLLVRSVARPLASPRDSSR